VALAVAEEFHFLAVDMVVVDTVVLIARVVQLVFKVES
jgi:hypothetical protein